MERRQIKDTQANPELARFFEKEIKLLNQLQNISW